MERVFDTLIVGGGPAGLAAALVLGRCLRRVALCDAGKQRNLASREIHAMPGQEGLEANPHRGNLDAVMTLSRVQ